MIARIWRGTTRLSDADRYQGYLNHFVIPSCQSAEGNKGVYILKECQGELVHFLLLSFWTSNEALVKHIGAEDDLINPTPDEKSLLLAFESNARHYELTHVFEEAMYKE